MGTSDFSARNYSTKRGPPNPNFSRSSVSLFAVFSPLWRIAGMSPVQETIAIDEAGWRHLQAAALDGPAGVELLVLALREAGILTGPAAAPPLPGGHPAVGLDGCRLAVAEREFGAGSLLGLLLARHGVNCEAGLHLGCRPALLGDHSVCSLGGNLAAAALLFAKEALHPVLVELAIQGLARLVELVIQSLGQVTGILTQGLRLVGYVAATPNAQVLGMLHGQLLVGLAGFELLVVLGLQCFHRQTFRLQRVLGHILLALSLNLVLLGTPVALPIRVLEAPADEGDSRSHQTLGLFQDLWT